jgi:hypothetical protein
MPKFSIIATDYEGHVPRAAMARGLDSLRQQTFRDFEVIICHDGPKSVPYEEEVSLAGLPNLKIVNTPEWMGDWGHHSREFAMPLASGEYLVNFNIDNILYPHALERISQKIDETESPIVIFSIYHHKIHPNALVPFSGIPPVLFNVDALQAVIRKDIWESVGYWYRYEDISDGMIIERICNEHGYFPLYEVLGENF